MELRSGKICCNVARKSREDLYKERKGQVLWKMVKKFGDTGEGKLRDAREVAINQDGDAAVTDFGSARVHVYSIDDGKLKTSIDTTKGLHVQSLPSYIKSNPYGVTVFKDKYIVRDFTPSPSVYDRCGNFVRLLDTPNCTIGHTHNVSITINSQYQVMFSCFYNEHICVSNIDNNRQTSSINAPIRPCYIATSSNDDKIVVSADSHVHGAQVIDTEGQNIHVLSPSKRVTSVWWPTGVCSNGEGEDEQVFVCNGQYASKPGVYRFSLTTGKYLSCVTTDVSDPRGIAFTDDGRIVVAEKKCVKVFTPTD